MVKDKYTVVSTFAGGGGSSCGYKMAGYKELLAIDFDKNAIETLKANYNFPIWERDIKTVTVKEILDFLSIKPGELDVLDGSPPCQGFSTAGKRQVYDERNDLFKEFTRLIDGLQPKVFVMENVSGMIKGTMKGKYLEIIKTLKSLNYNVKSKLMNAKYYEVPQSRERIIFIGVRNDLGISSVYPEPINKIITAKQAIEHLEDTDDYNKDSVVCEHAKYLKQGEKSGNVKNFPTKTRDMFRMFPNKPAPTITKNCKIVHYSKNRFITPLESQILTSFPEKYKFIGGEYTKRERVGNSVPPKMMYHIAKTIKEKVLDVYYKGCINA